MKGLRAVVWVLGALGWYSSPHAQGLSAEEYKLKAAFIYNFTQYVEWPATAFASPSAPFVVCVAGTNPFGEHLKALESRSYKTHAISVAFPKTIAEARNCHILYADDLRGTNFGRDPWKALADSPLLTVSSTSEATEAGIGIGFVIQSGRLRWALNLGATRQAQLKVSSKLIEIAASVTGETR
nr:YfiR family protein [uncultured Rhodoferax sp.]